MAGNDQWKVPSSVFPQEFFILYPYDITSWCDHIRYWHGFDLFTKCGHEQFKPFSYDNAHSYLTFTGKQSFNQPVLVYRNIPLFIHWCLVFSPLCICRILLSTPLAVISYFLIWYVPPFENGKVIWYLLFYCFFQTLQTVSVSHRCPHTDSHSCAILVDFPMQLLQFRGRTLHLLTLPCPLVYK